MGFGVRCRPFGVTGPPPLGRRSATFGETGLESSTGCFGERDQVLWGSGPSTLGFGFLAGFFSKSLILSALSEASFPLDLLTLF
jgi:hypothetical protein